MSIAYRSSASAVIQSSSTITVTKPTGLAEGDLLIADVGSTDEWDRQPYTPGWRVAFRDGDNSGVDRTQITMFKIATAADAAASDFTLNCDPTDWSHAIVSAWTIDGSDVLVRGKDWAESTGSPTTPTVTNPSSDALAYTALCGANRTGTAACSTSGYTTIEAATSGDAAHAVAYKTGTSSNEAATWNNVAHQYSGAAMILFEDYTPSGNQKFLLASVRAAAVGTSYSFDVPAAPDIQAGDLLVIAIWKNGQEPFTTTPTGWTSEVAYAQTSGTDSYTIIAWKEAESADESATSYTYEFTGGVAQYMTAYFFVFRPIGGGTPSFVAKATDKAAVNLEGPEESSNALTPAAGNLLIGNWGLGLSYPGNYWEYSDDYLAPFDEEYGPLGSTAFGWFAQTVGLLFDPSAQSYTYDSNRGFTGSNDGAAFLLEFTATGGGGGGGGGDQFNDGNFLAGQVLHT